MSDVTKDDLRHLERTLGQTIREGNAELHGRFDRLDSEQRDQAVLLGQHDIRIGALERSERGQWRAIRGGSAPPGEGGESRRAAAGRYSKVGGALAILLALLWGLIDGLANLYTLVSKLLERKAG